MYSHYTAGVHTRARVIIQSHIKTQVEIEIQTQVQIQIKVQIQTQKPIMLTSSLDCRCL